MAVVVPDSKSRYKVAGSAFDGQIKPEEVASLVSDLRATFATERTFSLSWRKQQLRNLQRMLQECEQELCEAMNFDLHKSYFEGYVTEISTILGEIDNALLHLEDWMKPQPKGNTALTLPAWSTVQYDPLGVVLVMGAWNYPIYLSLNPIVGALAAGNCILLKPGSYAVKSSHVLTKLVNKYLDPEAVRVVEGNRDVTAALLREKFDKIFFTGSGFVGKVVAHAAAEHLTPCVLELGGKSPTIVDKSADLQHAAERVVWGTFLNGGQTCVRPDFLLVEDSVADQFFELMKLSVKNFYGEKPKESEWFGRCINDSATQRLADLVKQHKPEIIIGGEVDISDKYISPTIFDFGKDLNKFSSALVMQDEIFGPLLPCARFTSVDQVVTFIRNLPTGKPLALYAFGSDTNFVNAMKYRTTAGGMCLNDVLLHLANHELPFGGVGNSGMGSYHGIYSFKCFSHEKAVLEKSQWLDQSVLFKNALQARFPPYDKGHKWKQMVIRSMGNPLLGKVMHILQKIDVNLLVKVVLFGLVMRLLGFQIKRV